MIGIDRLHQRKRGLAETTKRYAQEIRIKSLDKNNTLVKFNNFTESNNKKDCMKKFLY